MSATHDTTTRKLPVDLTAEELGVLGDRLSATLLERDAVADQKSQALAGFNANLKRLDGEAHQLATTIEARCEERPVQCQVIRDYGLGKVALRRTDTGEICFVRDMAPAEQQIQIGERVAKLEAEVAKAIKDFERQMTDDQRAAAKEEVGDLKRDLEGAETAEEKEERIREFFEAKDDTPPSGEGDGA